MSCNWLVPLARISHQVSQDPKCGRTNPRTALKLGVASGVVEHAAANPLLRSAKPARRTAPTAPRPVPLEPADTPLPSAGRSAAQPTCLAQAPATARGRGARGHPLTRQPARHPASARLLLQRPSAGVRRGQSRTASGPLPDDSQPRIPSPQPSAHPATGSNGARKRSQIPPHTSQPTYLENCCRRSCRDWQLI